MGTSHRSFRARVRVAALTACGALALTQMACGRQPEPAKTGAGAETPVQPHKHTNRLANTTSPYLLQHAHNPVDWYPWGPEALERAKKEDKPIFLSVGYSTCYWCHVMEREVFENEAIAALMNERFVCIKVDREERPDLDEIYMTATQMMTQGGGWPNSLFLTPDLKPFFAGTYFGATDQNGRPGFGTLVTQLGDAWKNQRDKVNEVSGRVADAIKNVLGERLASIPKATLDSALVNKAVDQIAASYDPTNGGFGLAPKFPSDFYYSFLLDVHAGRAAAGNKDEATLAMVTGTLDAMAAGGIHAHVGGGFHRYAPDGQWTVPHYEKKLYNQAHLAVGYLDAYAATGDSRHAEVARGVFRFVGEVFTGPQGQFYSALDAETDAVEGAYYVWTREEITNVLGDTDAAAFLAAFELADVPHFPGHKHPEGGSLVRKARGVANSPEIDAMLGKLAAVRKARKLPRLDDKAIAAWNGMMIDAYARGAEVLKDDAYRVAAAKAAAFVLVHMRTPDGRLVRSVRLADEKKWMLTPPHEGFLEDYAFVIRGLLALHRIETDPAAKARWLDAAKSLAAKADGLFWDGAQGGTGGGYFFATPQPDLIARGKDIGDNATPGGNSVMAHNLIDLWRATGDAAYRARSGELLAAFSGAMAQSPRGSVHMIHAVQRSLALDAAGDAARSAITIDGVAPGERADAPAAATDSSARVKASATVEPPSVAPGDEFTVTVKLAVDDGWHINANPASADFLIATVVDVRPAELPAAGKPSPIEVVRLNYPAAQKLKAEGLGADEIAVYGGSALVKVTVRLGKDTKPGATIPLRALATFQACADDGVCLKPSEWSGETSIRVSPPDKGANANTPGAASPFTIDIGRSRGPERAGLGVLDAPAPAWKVDTWFNLPEGKASLDLADFKGKVVYLYGFQSWCPGCHSQGFPTLQKLIDKFGKADDVAFVAVQTTFEGFGTNTAAKAKATGERYSLAIPIGHSGSEGKRSALMQAYKTGGTPWTIIIDKDGVVRYNDFHITPAQGERLISALRARPAGSAAKPGGR